jgi:hypothetical protein
LDVDLQSDGKIVVCGGFGSYEWHHWLDNFVRINTNGSIDYLRLYIGTGFDLHITRISAVVYSSGRIVVIGGSVHYISTGLPQTELSNLTTDGSIDTAWNVLGGFGTGAVHFYKYKRF